MEPGPESAAIAQSPIPTVPPSRNAEEGRPGSPALALLARFQSMGFALFGALALVAAVIFSQWDGTGPAAHWFWIVVGPLAGAACLFVAHRRYSGVGIDRDASPYFGLFGGAVFGSVVLAATTVEVWVLTGIFFAVAAVLAFMARLERSTIGMTAAVSVAMLTAATGASGLDTWVAQTLAAIGIMWVAAAGALRMNQFTS